MTTVLDERDGRTTMTDTARFPSQRLRDAMLATPMERGAGEGFDRLAAVLAAGPGLDPLDRPTTSDPVDPSDRHA